MDFPAVTLTCKCGMSCVSLGSGIWHHLGDFDPTVQAMVPMSAFDHDAEPDILDVQLVAEKPPEPDSKSAEPGANQDANRPFRHHHLPGMPSPEDLNF